MNVNKGKDKKHRIISTDPRKAFHTIQHPFIINTLPKLGMEGSYLNIIYATWDLLTANIILNRNKLIVFQLKSRRKGSPLARLLFNMGLEVLPTTVS